MANITITTSNITVDIHLEDISMESYNRLTAFLAQIDAEKDKKPEPVVSEPEKPSEASEGAVKTKQSGKTNIDRLKSAPHSKPVYDILMDAKAHPDRYDYKWMLTKDIVNLMPQKCRDTHMRAMGHTLGCFVSLGMLEKRLVKNGCPVEFRFPVRKAEAAKVEAPSEAPKAVNWRDQEAGEMLRKARKGADMTLGELSKAIGYGSDIINRWETGCYHMAQAQRDAINSYFGRNVFAEVTA